jgi:four helix bundle protein
MQLSHEKLDVYQKSVEFLALSSIVINDLPRGNAALADQLKRASLSIILNIAEATRRTSKLDNKKHFAIARGSALECAAVMDACLILNLTDKEQTRKGKALLVRVVSMLSKLCR